MAITISDTTPRVQYTATSGQTAFTVNFEFFANTDLKVYNASSLLTYAVSPSDGTEYSVTGAGVTGGGTVTLGSGGATLNDVITIYRDMPISRATDFPTSGAFQIASLNDELDKLTAMVQQVETDAKYSPKFSEVTSTGFDLTFPELVASKVISVNSGGTALEATHSITDVATVAGLSSEITTLSAISANITTVAGIAANVTSVAGDATDIGAVAAKATEIGRLGTADAVADLALLGTSAIVTDLDLLATSANVTAMGLLGTSAVVTDMGLLGTSAVVTDLDLLATAGNVTAMGLLGNSTTVANMALLGTVDAVADMNKLATTDIVADLAMLATTDIVADLAQLATTDFVADLNAIEAVKANVTTCADNLTGINNFADTYSVGSSNPTGGSVTAGDIFFNTTDSQFKYYNGSSWASVTAGIGSMADDTTPQLGGDLDLNSFDIPASESVKGFSIAMAICL